MEIGEKNMWEMGEILKNRKMGRWEDRGKEKRENRKAGKKEKEDWRKILGGR